MRLKAKKLLSGFLAFAMVLSLGSLPVTAAEGDVGAATSNTLHEGLVLYSSFDDATAKDLTNQGHDGTPSAALTFVDGGNGTGKAVKITNQNVANKDASAGDQYIDYGPSADILPATGNFSISIWYKADQNNASTNAALLGTKNFTSGSNKGFALVDYSSGLRANLAAENGGRRDINLSGKSAQLAAVKTDRAWHHLVVTVDRSGMMTYYVDGVALSGADNGPTDISGATGSIDAGLNLILGAGGNKCNATNSCTMDELLIYDRVITPAEVALLADKAVPDLSKLEPEEPPAPEGPFELDKNLILHSTFDAADREGTTVKDLSGKNHNGSAVGELQFVAGLDGEAVKFVDQANPGADGKKGDRYVDYGKSNGIIPAQENFTISFWFKSIGKSANGAAILGTKDYTSAANVGIVTGIINNELVYNVSAGTNYEMAVGKGSNASKWPGMLGKTSDEQWHNFVCVYDRQGNMTGYVDGEKTGAIGISGNKGSIDAGLNLVLGAGGNFNNAANNCYVDSLRIYDKALDDDAVAVVYGEHADAAKAANSGTALNAIQTALDAVTPSVVFPQTAIDTMQRKLDDAREQLADPTITNDVAIALVEDVKAAFQTFADGAKPLASFHMISDVHVENADATDTNALNYIAAMKDMETLNADTTIAMVNAGDFTGSGTASMYTGFYKATKEHNPVTDEQTLILLGNHDVRGSSTNQDPAHPELCPDWPAKKKLYQDNNAPYMPANSLETLYHAKTLGTVTDTEGYTFIMLNTELGLKDAMYMSDEQLAWFEDTMEAAYTRNPNKPIFIISHQALNDTHWRSNTLNGFDGVQTDGTGYPYQTGKDAAVKEIMAKYPNGIFLSGHIHNGYGVASVIPREYGVNVDVPALKGADANNGDATKGAGYEVMIYDGYVAIRARNFITGTWLPEYDVIIPVGDHGYPQLIQKLEGVMDDLLWYSEEDAAKLEAAFGDFWSYVGAKYNQAGISYLQAAPSDRIYLPEQLAEMSALADAAWKNLSVLDTVTRLESPRPAPLDSYEKLQQAWRAYLLGGDGTDLDLSVPSVAAYLDSLEANATNYWNNLIRSSQPRTSFIFPDLDMTQLTGDGTAAKERSANVVTTFSRLRTLALAWATKGTSFYQNDYVRDEIISATDYVVDNYYNTSINKAQGNWYHWDISSPTNLGNIAMVMYDVLGAERVEKYAKSIQWFAPKCEIGGPHSIQTGAMTGGNLLLKANAVAQAGILLKDSAMLENVSTKVKATVGVYNDPDKLFSTGNPGDGFYADGSYIQHQALPYIAGYGTDLYNNFSIFSTLLKGTEWEISYTEQEDPVIYDFVFSGVEPFIYKNHTMDLVTSRAITRKGYSDVSKTADIIGALVPMRGTFPTQEQNARFDSMLKYYLSLDSERYLSKMNSIYSIQMATELLNDASIQPRSNYALTKTFAMDRTVHLTEDFGLGIAMQSTRTFAHELIGEEGKRTWNIANGMVFLYDEDEDQYNGGYWCSIDPTRLPGTTTEHVVYGNGKGSLNTNIYDWTGGTSIGGNGVAGMHMRAMSKSDSPAAYSVGPRTGADMKKSYFMFGDRILMMGSSITSNTGDHVETIVDNRKIKPDGSNLITVDGAAADLNANAQELENPSWLHVQGNVAGSEIGYYFPQDITVQALKETRTGNWKDQGGDSGTATDTYATFYVDHGAKPTDAGYAYVLLPGKTAAETAAYAKTPDVEILRQDGSIHAARDKKQNITAANFWEAGTVAGITVSAPASVTMVVNGDTVTIGVSDPTQRDVPITLSLAASGELISADERITVDDASPFVKFSVDTTEGLGGTYTAVFKLSTTGQLELVSSVTKVKDMSVASNTPFGELGLPAYGVFVATDAAEHTLPILWTRGTYQPNVYGTYTVVGTPVLPDGMLNTTGVKLEAEITVADQKIAQSDTYVQDGPSADKVMNATGGTFPIKLDASNYYRKGIIRIDLAGVPADAEHIYFTFKINMDAKFQGGALYQVGSNWDQNTVTWNTLPARISNTALATFKLGDTNADGVLSLDVTDAVKAAIAAKESSISFVLEVTGTKHSSNQASVFSIESSGVQKPALSWVTELGEVAPADKENLTWLLDVVAQTAKERDSFVRWDEQGFTAAVNAAKLVLDNPAATSNDINDAEDALMVRLLSLRMKVLPHT